MYVTNITDDYDNITSSNYTDIINDYGNITSINYTDTLNEYHNMTISNCTKINIDIIISTKLLRTSCGL